MRRRIVGALAALVLFQGCDAEQRPSLGLFVSSSAADVANAVTEEFVRRSGALLLSVDLSSAGSQTLSTQIRQGAQADVFVSANRDHIAALEEAGLVRDVRTFALNRLVVIVPATNPAGLQSFWDLPRAERIVIGTEAVPVGRYTRRLLARASEARPTATTGEASFAERVMAHVVSQEANVRLVRSKVELGEADAAVVYRTDAIDRPDLRTIAVPEELNVLAEYRVGLVVRAGEDGVAAGDRTTAEAWVDFLASDRGRSILRDYGFTLPE